MQWLKKGKMIGMEMQSKVGVNIHLVILLENLLQKRQHLLHVLSMIQLATPVGKMINAIPAYQS